MATNYFNPEDEEKKKKEEEEGQGQVLGGEQCGLITGQQDQGSAPKKEGSEEGTRSGSWTNLNQYLDANRDRNFGQRVAGDVGKEVQEAKDYQGQATTGFRDQVQQNRVDYNDDLVKSAVSDPTNFSQNQDQVAAFKKLRDASYGGPVNLQDSADLYQPAARETQDAQEVAEASKSESGRNALLQRFYNRPTYYKGQQLLDQLILQNDPNARSAFADVQNTAAQNLGEWGQLQETLGQEGAAAKQATEEASQKTREAGTGALIGLQGDIEGRVSQFSTQKAEELAALRAALESKTLTDDLAERYGLERGQDIYNVDANQFIEEALDPTARSVASSDEAARFDALSGLMDQENTFLAGGQDQYGTYDPSKAVGFNTAGFNEAVAQAQRELEAQIQNTMVDYDASVMGGASGRVEKRVGQKPIMDRINELQPLLEFGAKYPNSPYVKGGGYARQLEEMQKLQQQLTDIKTNAGVGKKFS